MRRGRAPILLRVGNSEYVDVMHVESVEWSTANDCPVIYMRSGNRVRATDYSLNTSDYNDLKHAKGRHTGDLINEIRKAQQQA